MDKRTSLEWYQREYGWQAAEIERLQELLSLAAWYIGRYGDPQEDKIIYQRFLAASRGQPDPTVDEVPHG